MDPIESTPLGLARKAIDTATSELTVAYEAWLDEPDGPYDYHDLTVEPDPGSLGFALVLDFNDGPREDAEKVAARLTPLLLKHGIGTVRCRGYVADEATVDFEAAGVCGGWFDGSQSMACPTADGTLYPQAFCPGCLKRQRAARGSEDVARAAEGAGKP